ncbi:uncharacterized protein BX663DRAFT_485987 [Cokeromyces recurvatus]|uniref:uncharacterized protein n=1 Tax=Cokeromyces recurvatus TaxID=90255 RepID=UPI002220D0AA|nr:uncharacterized protein BX663DRAFT_485987 [Cokeromyces recurvatus]KAI7903253.1 hypothetical protein BX663DRAFT_485987 [Cokeromyces recurvatus]
MFSDDPMNNTNNGNMLIQQQQPMPTFLEASPNMGTPFLESSTMDTPFLDNNSADTPPFFDIAADISPYLIYGSFNITPYNNTFSNGVHNKQDICVAGYLNNYENNIAQLAHDPIATFNGDPSVLLIDKSKNPLSTTSYQPSSSPLPLPSVAVVTQDKPSPAVDLVETTVAEEESDSLFPPLTSSQQELATTIEHEAIKKENVTLDDILGFDHTSPLSESIEELSEQQELEESGYKQKEEEIPSMIKKEEEEAEEKVKKSRRGRKRKYPITEKKQKKEDNSTRKRSNLVKKPKEVKLYYCHICNHVSKRRYNLMTHIKTHDKSRIKEFGCTICEKRFDRRHDRDRHLATVHRGERSFTCKHCTTHFSRRDALNRHLIQRHEYNENDFVE